jgi:hypothetical protein
MTDAVVLAGEPLSQVERVVDAFVAPSKTFSDILRSTSWWLPFVIMVVVMTAATFAIDQKVGFEAVAQQQMTKTESSAERMQAMPADQREHAIKTTAMVTRYSTYGAFVIVLIFVSLEALILWGSFNFGLGAKTSFGQVFAVIMYAGMPRLFVSLLTVILLYAGVGVDSFDIQNPVGTNIGYFIQDHPALRAAGSFFDVFGLWSLALLVIGMAIISRKSIGQAATVVVGWWFLGLLLLTGVAAAFG